MDCLHLKYAVRSIRDYCRNYTVSHDTILLVVVYLGITIATICWANMYSKLWPIINFNKVSSLFGTFITLYNHCHWWLHYCSPPEATGSFLSTKKLLSF